MHKWRLYNYLYAFLFGYFWLPCPLCGKKFGGHEWDPDNTLFSNWDSGKGVCRNCGSEARKRNALLFSTTKPEQRIFNLGS